MNELWCNFINKWSSYAVVKSGILCIVVVVVAVIVAGDVVTVAGDAIVRCHNNGCPLNNGMDLGNWCCLWSLTETGMGIMTWHNKAGPMNRSDKIWDTFLLSYISKRLTI